MKGMLSAAAARVAAAWRATPVAVAPAAVVAIGATVDFVVVDVVPAVTISPAVAVARAGAAR